VCTDADVWLSLLIAPRGAPLAALVFYTGSEPPDARVRTFLPPPTGTPLLPVSVSRRARSLAADAHLHTS
jgi:hypothetical protein